jgi:hypothetical protein
MFTFDQVSEGSSRRRHACQLSACCITARCRPNPSHACMHACMHATSTRPPKVYSWDSNQREIFDITARPIIDAVMDGYNGEGAGMTQWAQLR